MIRRHFGCAGLHFLSRVWHSLHRPDGASNYRRRAYSSYSLQLAIAHTLLRRDCSCPIRGTRQGQQPLDNRDLGYLHVLHVLSERQEHVLSGHIDHDLCASQAYISPFGGVGVYLIAGLNLLAAQHLTWVQLSSSKYTVRDSATTLCAG